MFSLSQVDIDSWIQLISGAGLGAAMAVFLIWKAFQDKDEDRKRLDSLESFIHGELLQIIKTESQLNQQCLEVIRENTVMYQRTLAALDKYEGVE